MVVCIRHSLGQQRVTVVGGCRRRTVRRDGLRDIAVGVVCVFPGVAVRVMMRRRARDELAYLLAGQRILVDGPVGWIAITKQRLTGAVLNADRLSLVITDVELVSVPINDGGQLISEVVREGRKLRGSADPRQAAP